MKSTSAAILLGLIGCVSLALIRSGEVSAQAFEPWSLPVRVSEEGIPANRPDVLADTSGQVHLFWLARLDNTKDCLYDTTMYARFSDGVWSEPRDVLVSPSGWCLSLTAAAFSPQDGRLHAVFTDYNLYHSSASAGEAGSARSWSAPVLIDSNALYPDVVVDSKNRIHVAYYHNRPDWEIYYSRSDDGGLHWTAPHFIYDAQGDDIIESLELAVDEQDRLHLVWSEQFFDGVTQRGGIVHYVRSTDAGSTWESPFVIDKKDARYVPAYGAGEIAIVTAGKDQVHVVWNGPPSGHRWYRWSADGGATWEAAQPVAPLDAFSGQGLKWYNAGSDLAVDGAGRVHLLTSSTKTVHAIWQDGHWSALDVLLPIGPYWPRMAISNGNMLHVVSAYYYMDGSEGPVGRADVGGVGQGDLNLFRVWCTAAHTDAPALPTQALPRPSPSEPIRVVPKATSTDPVGGRTASPEATRLTGKDTFANQRQAGTLGSVSSVILGVLPAALLVLIVLAVRSRRRR